MIILGRNYHLKKIKKLMLIMSRKVEMGGKVGGEDKVMFLVEQMRCWEKHCQTPLFSVSPHFTPFQQGSGVGRGVVVWGVGV